MKVLSPEAHGIMDYLVGILLIAAPYILDFDRGGAETWVPIIVGAVIILQALMTRFEVGAFRVMPMSLHLTMDYVIGIFLAASPWIFDFADYIYLPHLIVGIMIILEAMMTRTTSDHNHATNSSYTRTTAHEHSR